MSAPAAPRGAARLQPISRYGWWVLFVLALAMLVSYIDRQIIALVVEPMKDDLGYSDTQVGWLYSGFAIFYALAGLPIAWLADRKSRHALISTGIFLWSMATIVCGLVRGYWALFAARIGVGVGEATLTPAAYSMLGDMLPRERLPMAMSVFQIGAVVGSGLAFVVGGFVVSWVRHAPPVDMPLIGELFSWQLTFIYVGAPGLLVLLLFLTIREPVRRQSVQMHETVKAGSWGQVWHFYRTNWAVIVPHHTGFALLITVGYAFVFWSPSFFERVHHIPAEEASIIYGSIFVVFGAGGTICAALFAQYLGRRGHRAGPFTAAMTGTALFLPTVVLIQFVPELTLVYVLYAPAMFLMNTPFGLGHGALAQIAPPEVRGRVAAIYTLVGSAGNALGPPVAGWLNDDVFTGVDGVRFSLITMVCVFGVLGLAFLWLGRRPFMRALRRAEEAELTIVRTDA